MLTLPFHFRIKCVPESVTDEIEAENGDQDAEAGRDPDKQ
jgi:hypothetical protein